MGNVGKKVVIVKLIVVVVFIKLFGELIILEGGLFCSNFGLM